MLPFLQWAQGGKQDSLPSCVLTTTLSYRWGCESDNVVDESDHRYPCELGGADSVSSKVTQEASWLVGDLNRDLLGLTHELLYHCSTECRFCASCGPHHNQQDPLKSLSHHSLCMHACVHMCVIRTLFNIGIYLLLNFLIYLILFILNFWMASRMKFHSNIHYIFLAKDDTDHGLNANVKKKTQLCDMNISDICKCILRPIYTWWKWGSNVGMPSRRLIASPIHCWISQQHFLALTSELW